MFRNAHNLPGLVALFALLLSSGPALASQGEHVLSATALYAGVYAGEGGSHQQGAGLSLGYRYGLSDFFSFTGDLTYAPLFPGGGVEHLGMVRAGVTYTIDALEWVPWLGLQAVAFLRSSDPLFDSGFAAGLGLDYRPRRTWSIGVEAWYHAMLGHLDEFPATVTAGLRVSWYPQKEY